MAAIGALIAATARRLRSVAGSSARLEAELLLGHVTGWSRAEVLAHPERTLTAEAAAAFEALIARRLEAEPIAYLLGEREFYGRLFKVDRRALIPRPETELLVDLGVAAVARWRSLGVEPTVLDVGTGCGAIAVSVAAEASVAVTATDVSADALALAAENAALHAPGRVVLANTDLLQGVAGPLHVVLANLPYVPRDRPLPRDVIGYEPAVALFGGPRGTELIERLLRQARDRLAAGGEVAVELDEEAQAAPVAALARELWAEQPGDIGATGAQVSVCRDAGGYERVVRVVRLLPPPPARLSSSSA